MSNNKLTLKEAIAAVEEALASLEEVIEEDKENDAVSSTHPLYEDDDGEFTAADLIQGRKIRGKVRPKSVSDRFRNPNYGLEKVRRSE